MLCVICVMHSLHKFITAERTIWLWIKSGWHWSIYRWAHKSYIYWYWSQLIICTINKNMNQNMDCTSKHNLCNCKSWKLCLAEHNEVYWNCHVNYITYTTYNNILVLVFFWVWLGCFLFSSFIDPKYHDHLG